MDSILPRRISLRLTARTGRRDSESPPTVLLECSRSQPDSAGQENRIHRDLQPQLGNELVGLSVKCCKPIISRAPVGPASKHDSRAKLARPQTTQTSRTESRRNVIFHLSSNLHNLNAAHGGKALSLDRAPARICSRYHLWFLWPFRSPLSLLPFPTLFILSHIFVTSSGKCIPPHTNTHGLSPGSLAPACEPVGPSTHLNYV